MKKRISAMLICIIACVSILLVPANAKSIQSENFDVYINAGATVSSKMAQKTTPESAPMQVQAAVRTGSTVKWTNSEKLDVRGRSSSGGCGQEVGPSIFSESPHTRDPILTMAAIVSPQVTVLYRLVMAC